MEKFEENAGDSSSPPLRSGQQPAGAGRRRARSIRQEFPDFLIRLVGERRLQCLPVEAPLSHRYD